ncbi:lasso peptide biosynthesis B2 protein [Pseudomonas cedrina]|uniref:lasso peptide biosynthesis B2 protein n=1 Tax=Pseudomonas cedrina TaxID=651740 RepID=UPI0027824858|nr:lasso peptide biosynthesis B2 protein [Pseudomonas cedrina]MDQ0654020.1 hypothetical protein [Pseudomonas cedrina]
MNPEQNETITWAKEIHAAHYNSQIIILNEIHDRFIFFDHAQSAFIDGIIHTSLVCHSSDTQQLINQLIDTGILLLCHHVTRNPYTEIKNSLGAFECDWRNGDDSWQPTDLRPVLILKALSRLKQARKLADSGKLTELLDNLRNGSARQDTLDHTRLVTIGRNINFAIKLFNGEVKCLEFAYSLAAIAFEEHLWCKFNIGVQTHSFISHAWVEGPLGVILDKPALPRDLAIIFSIGITK